MRQEALSLGVLFLKYLFIYLFLKILKLFICVHGCVGALRLEEGTRSQELELEVVVSGSV